jgi:hypothetical protein
MRGMSVLEMCSASWLRIVYELPGSAARAW